MPDRETWYHVDYLFWSHTKRTWEPCHYLCFNADEVIHAIAHIKSLEPYAIFKGVKVAIIITEGGDFVINIKRGAGVWFAYDLMAVSPVGRIYKQGYYEDEYETAKVDADTLEKLGYTDVKIVERDWHKRRTRKYGHL